MAAINYGNVQEKKKLDEDTLQLPFEQFMVCWLTRFQKPTVRLVMCVFVMKSQIIYFFEICTR